MDNSLNLALYMLDEELVANEGATVDEIIKEVEIIRTKINCKQPILLSNSLFLLLLCLGLICLVT